MSAPLLSSLWCLLWNASPCLSADSLLEREPGFLPVIQDWAFPHTKWRKAPPSPLCLPAQSASVPPSAPQVPPALQQVCLWERPWDHRAGLQGSQACLLGSQLTQPRVAHSVEWQVSGGGRQTTLCPTGTDPPAIGFLREPLQPPPAASLVLPLNPSGSSISALATLGPPAGPPSLALTALTPAQAAQ